MMVHDVRARFHSVLHNQISVTYGDAFIINCPSQETEETTRPVENVALTTEGLQEKKTTTCEWDDSGKK